LYVETRRQRETVKRTEPRTTSDVHHLAASIGELLAASQRPKIIAPIVKMAAPTQMTMAAFFSEMLGVGFMVKQPHRDH
jgi:hypothetical protein